MLGKILSNQPQLAAFVRGIQPPARQPKTVPEVSIYKCTPPERLDSRARTKKWHHFIEWGEKQVKGYYNKHMKQKIKNSDRQTANMIELRAISKYSDTPSSKDYVLRDIDLDVKEGEFLSIIGSSASGKSTLLNIIGMLESPSDGKYNFCGQEIRRLDKSRKNEISSHFGYISPRYGLNRKLTVYKNMETHLLTGDLSVSERETKIVDMLERFHIAPLRNFFPFQLSQPQQQLAAIAKAVIANPKLILADEPTGNLNSRLSKGIMELLKRLNRGGTTIIQATSRENTAAYSNRIVSLNRQGGAFASN